MHSCAILCGYTAHPPSALCATSSVHLLSLVLIAFFVSLLKHPVCHTLAAMLTLICNATVHRRHFDFSLFPFHQWSRFTVKQSTVIATISWQVTNAIVKIDEDKITMIDAAVTQSHACITDMGQRAGRPATPSSRCNRSGAGRALRQCSGWISYPRQPIWRTRTAGHAPRSDL